VSVGVWLRPVLAGAAVLLAGAPVGAVVAGDRWWMFAAGAVAVVVAVGVSVSLVAAALARDALPGMGVVAAAAQLAALAVSVTALFTESGVLGVVPGSAATAELAALLDDAGGEIRDGVSPVPATTAILLLVTAAFGVATVIVHAAAVAACAPAAAGVPLLAVFAVPAALADELLPGWMLAAAAAGFGLLLLTGPVAVEPLRRRAGTAAIGVALTAVAATLALAVGSAAGSVGTAGRLPETAAGAGGTGGALGLSPFTALRGQLQQSVPTELFRVSGLPRPTYLRALTLRTYVPDVGWEPTRPDAGLSLVGELPDAEGPGDRATVRVENLDFRDYWLPVYGQPLAVAGVDARQWAYDPVSGTAFTSRPRQEPVWTQRALLPAPTAADLRAADGTTASRVDPAFLSTDGVDPRVAAVTEEVTRGATSGFDRAVALTEWFTGPTSPFSYDLSTAPGNGDDSLVEFLLEGRRGYCEQFASAMAVMLRTVGVPTRVAVGFTGGDDDAGDARVVSTADAHAWVEAWFPGIGWTAFDPTPLTDGRGLVPPYVAESLAAAAEAPETSAVPLPSQSPPIPEPPLPEEVPAPDEPATEPDSADALDAPWLVPALVGGLVTAALSGAAAAPVFWRERLRRRRLAAAAAGGPDAAAAAWSELLAESSDGGVLSPPTDTVRAAARRFVHGHGLDERARAALATVVETVEESWYGGVDPAPGVLASPMRTVLDGMRTRRRPLPARFLPASVVRRRGATTITSALPEEQNAAARD
jgi:transglutaminase-like putative cysteine protease